VRVLAIFGPTAVGKTGVAIETAELLRARGEDPVAVSCDSIQVYRGLEILSGAATPAERQRLEHRLLGIVGVDEEFSAGRFAKLAHAQIDELLAEGRRPIVVGGTGLYMRAALSELKLRPAVPSEVRAGVEADLAERGPAAMHAELSPELASGVHPNDRKRIVRLTELARLGIAPHRTGEGMWSEQMRIPTTLVGLTMAPDLLLARIDARVEEMVRLGAQEDVLSAERRGASRTARAAIGYDEMLIGNVEGLKSAHWRYARRQLTWMRRMEDVVQIDRSTRDDASVAAHIAGLLEEEEA
jgi:tRNA dimethylallyltransferase